LLIPVGEVSGNATLLVADRRLASYDAVHAASAAAAGPGAIVTADAGFALLPASLLAIYTDRSRGAR
jgi:predicted nucleic acid-binding protein